MILLVQGVYNIMSINNVDGSIQTLYKAMEQINQIEEEINIPIGETKASIHDTSHGTKSKYR